MLDALNITEEEALGLTELAQHDLALARDFARRAQAATDTDEANTLARSYQRAARSYRQTLALKARLRREVAAAGQDAAARTEAARAPREGAAVGHRIADLREALLRLVWDEAEGPEDEPAEGDGAGFDVEAFTSRCEAVEGAVKSGRWARDFTEEPLDDQVTRLALGLGFTPEAAAGWRELADPPDWAFEIEPDRQSSA
jgi:hypothetical protein